MLSVLYFKLADSVYFADIVSDRDREKSFVLEFFASYDAPDMVSAFKVGSSEFSGTERRACENA